jgi:Co/Zn/Cd efflux system component/copper chaperone CopZ
MTSAHVVSSTRDPVRLVRHSIAGMDCARDAAEIERAVRAVPGVIEVKVSVASQVMTTRAGGPQVLDEVEGAVRDLGYRLHPIESPTHDVAGESGAASLAPNVAPWRTSAYRQALGIVVLLNAGFGLLEGVGGVLARSQSLQADALDFLGDGLITWLGLLAIGWRAAWRARAALLQGLFLGALGIAVLASTAYRVFAAQHPRAEVMGLVGVAALVVNVACALILIPHRHGDANARAVWLFSRNDALGNLGVVVAAALVAWTGTRWPDLVVALVLATLFLHSAWVIVRDARADLREARRPATPA